MSNTTETVRGRKRLSSAARKALVPALAVAAIGTIVACAGSAQASSSPAANRSSVQQTSTPATQHPKPTIVLVHGAWADSTGWTKVVSGLTRAGYPVRTVANPLRGLTSDSDYVRAQLAAVPGPVVLVAHSYGGAVITNAARGATNVKALVYVAGYAPDKGESLRTILPPETYPTHFRQDSLLQVKIPNAAAEHGYDADLYIKAEQFRDIFASDVSARSAAAQAAAQRPLAGTAYGEPSGEPAWKSIRSYDLITTKDHAINPDGQRFMAKRMHAETATVSSGHDVMISHPRDVIRIVERAAAGK